MVRMTNYVKQAEITFKSNKKLVSVVSSEKYEHNLIKIMTYIK